MDFYNFFSFSGKKAIYRASEVSAQFNNQYLEPEHILYSILNLRACSAVQVMHELGVNMPKMAYSLEAYLYEHAGNHKGSNSFSTRTLALLDTAFKEVKRLRHREIGTTHLLLGLSQERSPFLKNLFSEHDLGPLKVSEAFAAHLTAYRHSERDASRSEEKETGPIGSRLHARVRLSSLVMSPSCQKIFASAAMQSFNSGSSHIEPLHIFIAILGEQGSTALRVLQKLGMDTDSVRQGLKEQLQIDGAKPGSQEGISDHCQELLNRAQDIQHRLRQRELLTAHILLEMLHDPDAELKPLFEAAGISFGAALKQFLKTLLEKNGNGFE